MKKCRLPEIVLLLSLFVAGARPASALGVADMNGYWQFDEGAGASAGDGSNNKSTGTLQGGAQWATGAYGSALAFDGVDDRVQVSSSSAFNAAGDFAIDLWIKPGQWGKNEKLLSNNVFEIYHRGEWAGDKLYFMLRIDSTAYSGDSAWNGWAAACTVTSLQKDAWYHFTALRSGTTMAVYLNGIKEKEVNALAGYAINSADMGDLYIGGAGSFFNGLLDEVRIWNKALTTSEIRGLYQYPPLMIALYDQTIHEGTSLEFIVTALSASDGNVTYSVSGLPQGAAFTPLAADEIFDPYGSGMKFTWTPATGQTGTFPLRFSARCGTWTDQRDVILTVTPNSLLHGPYGGYMCRGDGDYVEDVRREYGADANPTGEPPGGGVGYSRIVDSGTADYFVGTKAELLAALKQATSGQVVYIADQAQFDMTGSENVVIPGGVTLASGRGRNGSLGALLFCDKLKTIPLLITGGESVRMTGLRLRGPDQNRRNEQMTWLYNHVPNRYYDIPNSRGIQSSYPRLVVDNCELSGWSHGAVVLQNGSYDNHVHHNFIHRNQRSGLGYGVVLTNDASALIEANVFDWNRHSIAGSRGLPGGSYEARYNIDLGNANSHVFDMHGGNDIPDDTIPAGKNVCIHHNTFLAASGQPAVVIRGVPVTGVWVYSNWALHDPAVFTSQQLYRQALGSLPGHTPYEKMQVYDNAQGPTPPAETGKNFETPSVPLRVASLQGEGTVTLFWEVPVSSGSRAITHFRIYRNNAAIATTGAAERSFTDTTPENGVSYSYEVAALSDIGEGPRSATISLVARGSWSKLESRAYPNPVDFGKADRVRILYALPAEEKVSIMIYTFAGELVKTLVRDETFSAGEHYADWHGDTDGGHKTASGMYLAVVKAGGSKTSNKIAVLR